MVVLICECHGTWLLELAEPQSSESDNRPRLSKQSNKAALYFTHTKFHLHFEFCPVVKPCTSLFCPYTHTHTNGDRVNPYTKDVAL